MDPPRPSISPVSCPPSVWDLFRTILTPGWIADWYRTHDLHGGGGVFSPLLTLWLLLQQRLSGAATQEAVWSQLTLAQARHLSPTSKRVCGGWLSPVPSGYSYARQHLPLSVVEAACDLVFDDLARRAALRDASPRSVPVYLLDGSSLTLTPSPALRAAFPPSVNQHGPSHWSVVRMVVAHQLPTGLAVRPAWGPMYGPQATSEQALATQILPQVPAGAWVIADRNFGVFSVAWTIVAQGQTPVVRMLEARAQKVVGAAVDLTRDGDHAVVWTPSYQDRCTNPGLPKTARLRGRLIVRHVRPEGRPVCLCLFTTSETAKADHLVDTYGQRWLIEVDVRSLKQTVSIESTGVRSPALLAQDLLMAVSAYNLLRWLMHEAALWADLPARRISFTRTLHYARAYAPRLAQVEELAVRQQLWREMLRAIAALPLPVRQRPGRPRTVWRRPHTYAARNAQSHST